MMGDVEPSVRSFVDARNGYWAMVDEWGDLAAFCCFGLDAQVPGGDYGMPALDIGLGVRPDLTGQGNGSRYVSAVLGFAQRTSEQESLRVTVAEFNERARRVWQEAGFSPVQRFERQQDNRPFVILVRQATMEAQQGDIQ